MILSNLHVWETTDTITNETNRAFHSDGSLQNNRHARRKQGGGSPPPIIFTYEISHDV